MGVSQPTKEIKRKTSIDGDQDKKRKTSFKKKKSLSSSWTVSDK